MARKRKAGNQEQVGDYRHDARRKNNPPAGIAPTYEMRERRATSYTYDPHLDPQLQWTGKAEHTSFDVDVVSLHIHERISTRAILDAVRRSEPLQLSLFGETPLPMNQQIEFYQHEVGWANRLGLGDSLLVMNSLLVKEGMAGKVQMIYMDPPYGIKYASNFQPRVDRRDMKDKDEDLTRELLTEIRRHTITVPMPERVVKVLVKVGDTVKAGQGIVVIEAMKMETELTSQTDGKVKGVHVQEGDRVNGGDVLVVVE